MKELVNFGDESSKFDGSNMKMITEVLDFRRAFSYNLNTSRIFGMFMILWSLQSCQPYSTNNEINENSPSFSILLMDSPSIEGKKEYLSSPYVTAGNRVYMVGHQDGSFPEIGWHIQGEMGGIWNHPIKLMDGFDIELNWSDYKVNLNNAIVFTNFPFANMHKYLIKEKEIEVERWQFVPDNKEGIVIQLLVKNFSTKDQEINLRFKANSDLRPTWLGERTNMYDGEDITIFDKKLDAWIIKDSLNPWFGICGADRRPTAHNSDRSHLPGKGAVVSLDFNISVGARKEERIEFIIAGSYISQEAAIHTFRDIKNNIPIDFQAKQLRYQQIAERSKLTISDKKLQEVFEWLKYNSDWLVRSVPEIGTGISAGIPDYPWWFGCDSEYALKGCMATGNHEIAIETIKLLDSISNAVNGNGRIIHEVSTNGAVYNAGNINETPQFVSLIWEVYQWTGDDNFLRKYFPAIKKGLTWLMEENDKDRNLFPEGFGMMEIHGLNTEMIDVASYTQRAFEDGARISQTLGELALYKEYSTIAAALKSKINENFWSEKNNSYADFLGNNQQALTLIEDAIKRAEELNKPWAVQELQETKKGINNNSSQEIKPFVLHHNWVVNTPMEMGIAEEDNAIKALNTASKFTNPFGMFVTGIDRDENAGLDDGSFQGTKAFSYTGAVMTLPTGVQAIAENNYGRPDAALQYLNKMAHSFSYAFPGSMYEVSPDYGMITQAWNIYSFAIPIVQQFFGIQPNAYMKEVLIQPMMPHSWNDASLENVRIGNNQISVFYKKSETQTMIRVEQTMPDWTVKIKLPNATQSNLEILQGSILERNNNMYTTKDPVLEIVIKN